MTCTFHLAPPSPTPRRQQHCLSASRVGISYQHPSSSAALVWGGEGRRGGAAQVAGGVGSRWRQGRGAVAAMVVAVLWLRVGRVAKVTGVKGGLRGKGGRGGWAGRRVKGLTLVSLIVIDPTTAVSPNAWARQRDRLGGGGGSQRIRVDHPARPQRPARPRTHAPEEIKRVTIYVLPPSSLLPDDYTTSPSWRSDNKRHKTDTTTSNRVSRYALNSPAAHSTRTAVEPVPEADCRGVA